ncbi:unnamed protein product [Cuscuta europaea]|uniref:Uncharacterized protein n=1 Tax=Cuscuta europaea TaxID=41803 RepID=A0A9P0ZGP5_CUSEU|nr:unnamed protein product [Cuscuta europaea]
MKMENDKSDERQGHENPIAEADTESGASVPFIVDLGFDDSVLEAEADLLFEDEFNYENEDDEELKHGRVLLGKLVTNQKGVGKSKGHKSTNHNILEEDLVVEEDGHETEYFSSSNEGSYKSGSQS